MSNNTDISSETPESIWAFIRELAKRQAETDRILDKKFAALALQVAETDQIVKATALQMAETDQIVKATALQMAKTDRQISRLEKQIGGVTNSHGSFAEEYFYNSLRRGNKQFFGEKFDKLIRAEIMHDENNIMKGELDLILINCISAAIIEVKFKVREKHIEQVKKKVKRFRERFPEYKNHRVILGLASMVFDEDIQNKCIENGIAVIQQIGDTFVINDDNLKRH